MDSDPGSVTDQPYEAAIAAFGALIAGFSGILGFGRKLNILEALRGKF